MKHKQQLISANMILVHNKRTKFIHEEHYI